ncbi:mCG144526, partial [Mus musculus]
VNERRRLRPPLQIRPLSGEQSGSRSQPLLEVQEVSLPSLQGNRRSLICPQKSTLYQQADPWHLPLQLPLCSHMSPPRLPSSNVTWPAKRIYHWSQSSPHWSTNVEQIGFRIIRFLHQEGQAINRHLGHDSVCCNCNPEPEGACRELPSLAPFLHKRFTVTLLQCLHNK